MQNISHYNITFLIILHILEKVEQKEKESITSRNELALCKVCIAYKGIFLAFPVFYKVFEVMHSYRSFGSVLHYMPQRGA